MSKVPAICLLTLAFSGSLALAGYDTPEPDSGVQQRHLAHDWNQYAGDGADLFEPTDPGESLAANIPDPGKTADASDTGDKAPADASDTDDKAPLANWPDSVSCRFGAGPMVYPSFFSRT